mgnify:CR=1 FL=1
MSRSPEHEGSIQRGLMIAPLIIALVILTLVPFIFTAATSFTDFNLTRPKTWGFVGLEQYVRLINDPRWWSTFWRGLSFIIIPTLLQMAFGLALALLLHKGIRAVKYFRAFFLLPMVLPPVVVGVIWKIFLLRDVGGMNAFTDVLGLPFFGFLESATGAYWAIILIVTWEWTPFVMLFILAGLETLPEEVFEAARIDGAGVLQEIKYVTLPLLKPTLLVVLLFRIMESTKIFPIIFSVTNGGPAQATENMDFYAYLVGFRFFDFGYSSALLVAILFVLGLICAPLFPALVNSGRKADSE